MRHPYIAALKEPILTMKSYITEKVQHSLPCLLITALSVECAESKCVALVSQSLVRLEIEGMLKVLIGRDGWLFLC